MAKVFLIDINACNGCYNCQIACKDEHCEQPWMPYAQAQPLTGQFWMNVKEKERGRVPFVRVSYVPTMCTHCEDAPCAKVKDGAVYKREDGLVIIDPTKAKGCKEIVDACPMGAVYWNEELSIPQKCTGCAHLLDDGWEVPRCVDACPMGALKFVDESEVDMEKAETLPSTAQFGPKVYYYNLPKRFVAATVFDRRKDEVAIGVEVKLLDQSGSVVSSTTTDEFGDFKFDQVPPAAYTVSIPDVNGESIRLGADATSKDVVFDDIDISLSKCAPVSAE